MTETDAVLRYPGGELPLPVVKATEGADGFDTSKLLSTTGQVALDIGFVNTASCTSAITYIDGDAGILRYRGYPIDQLAESSPSIVTPLNKYIGYEEAAIVAKQSLKEKKTIRQVVLERGYVDQGKLTEQQLDEALDVLSMTHP